MYSHILYMLLYCDMAQQISVEDVQKAIIEQKDFILVDVRTPGEYERGNIAGSINIPLDDIDANISQRIPDKQKTIYMYCLSGARSDSAADILTQFGYQNVFSMTSGLLMWRSKKIPLS